MNDTILKTFTDIEHLSQWAAYKIVETSHRAISMRGRFLLVLNGGGTPQRLFELLGTDFRDKIDWSRAHLFWGDERCVPPDNKESNYGQAHTAFLGRIQISESNVHRIQGELNPGDASKNYSETLKQFAAHPLKWPHFDLVLLGMGEDGHTASLFPGSPLDATEPAIAVTGHYQGRPAQRVTLTPPVLNSARTVLFMVTGENKAETLRRVLGNEHDPSQLPAQRITPENGQVIWLVDEAAASRLPRNEP